jgi:hypothetical protein
MDVLQVWRYVSLQFLEHSAVVIEDIEDMLLDKKMSIDRTLQPALLEYGQYPSLRGFQEYGQTSPWTSAVR